MTEVTVYFLIKQLLVICLRSKSTSDSISFISFVSYLASVDHLRGWHGGVSLVVAGTLTQLVYVRVFTVRLSQLAPVDRILQYWSLSNWQNLRLRCGCVAVPVNWYFDIISSCFAKFKNVVHSLEPGETPSNSASHQAPNYVQRS